VGQQRYIGKRANSFEALCNNLVTKTALVVAANLLKGRKIANANASGRCYKIVRKYFASYHAKEYSKNAIFCRG
jgi:hypothetical protein